MDTTTPSKPDLSSPIQTWKNYLPDILASTLYPIGFCIMMIFLCKWLDVDNIGEFQAPKTIQIASIFYVYLSLIFIIYCAKWQITNPDKNTEDFFLYKLKVDKAITISGGMLIGMILSTITADFFQNQNINTYYNLIGIILTHLIISIFLLTDAQKFIHSQLIRIFIVVVGIFLFPLFVMALNLITHMLLIGNRIQSILIFLPILLPTLFSLGKKFIIKIYKPKNSEAE